MRAAVTALGSRLSAFGFLSVRFVCRFVSFVGFVFVRDYRGGTWVW